MKRTSKLDKQIESAYYRLCAGTSIAIMDMSSLYQDATDDINAGMDVDKAVSKAINKYNSRV